MLASHGTGQDRTWHSKCVGAYTTKIGSATLGVCSTVASSESRRIVSTWYHRTPAQYRMPHSTYASSVPRIA
eukprot:3260585-Rhodomonas_salina.8